MQVAGILDIGGGIAAAEPVSLLALVGAAAVTGPRRERRALVEAQPMAGEVAAVGARHAASVRVDGGVAPSRTRVVALGCKKGCGLNLNFELKIRK